MPPSSNTKRSAQQRARLRCCASCEWIYLVRPKTAEDNGRDCPKCGFAAYGARSVHGDRAYKFLITQAPWLKRSLARVEMELRSQIVAHQATLPDTYARVNRLTRLVRHAEH